MKGNDLTDQGKMKQSCNLKTQKKQNQAQGPNRLSELFFVNRAY